MIHNYYKRQPFKFYMITRNATNRQEGFPLLALLIISWIETPTGIILAQLQEYSL